MRNDGNQDVDIIRNQKWPLLFSIIASSTLYQIGFMFTEYYLNNDRLPLSYHFLIGISASLLSLLIENFSKNKLLPFRRLLILAILAVLVICALLIPRPENG